jgi:DNA-binding IclR family transcriptional regulator
MAIRPRITLEPAKPRATAYSTGRAEERKGVGAVEAAVEILRVLDFAGGPLSLGQVARAAGFLPSRTHHYLVSLVRTELAQQDVATGLYSLGDYAKRLGKNSRQTSALARRVNDAMRAFSLKTRQSALFAQWSRQGPVVTHWTDGRKALSVVSRVGAAVPLWGSPTGDIFLAWMPASDLQRARELGLLDGVSPRQLAIVRAKVLRAGTAQAAGRRNAAIAAVAVPVFTPEGNFAGAMTTIGLRGDLDDASDSKITRLLRDTARLVSLPS